MKDGNELLLEKWFELQAPAEEAAKRRNSRLVVFHSLHLDPEEGLQHAPRRSSDLKKKHVTCLSTKIEG